MNARRVTIAGKLAGSGASGEGYSAWMKAPAVTVKLRGLKPQAGSVQYGAPEPPEKRDHYGET